MSKADAEDSLAWALTASGGLLAAFERQYAYVPARRFRADFCWPAQRLIVEIQGGVYTGQAHGSVTGVLADIQRLNLATLHGYRVLRFVPAAVENDEIAETLDLIEKCLSRVSEVAAEDE